MWNLEEDDNQIFISACLFGLFIQQSGFWGYAYEIYVWYVREQLDTLSHEMSHVSLPFFIFLFSTTQCLKIISQSLILYLCNVFQIKNIFGGKNQIFENKIRENSYEACFEVFNHCESFCSWFFLGNSKRIKIFFCLFAGKNTWLVTNTSKSTLKSGFNYDQRFKVCTYI